MDFCSNCGKQLEEGAKFCFNCGKSVGGAAPEQETQQKNTQQQANFTDKVKDMYNTADTTADYEVKDIEDNKWLAILSYIGPLVFIPMFVKKDSAYTRYHVNQGFNLFLLDVAYGIVQAILTAILCAIFPWRWNYGWFGGRGIAFDVITTILGLVWLAMAALMVLGIINAATGKAKELPIIGKFDILSKFMK